MYMETLLEIVPDILVLLLSHCCECQQMASGDS